MSTNDWKDGPNRRSTDESDIGKQIEDLVQNAVNSFDFSGLSEKIKSTIDITVEQTGNAARQAKDVWQKSTQDWQQKRPTPPVQKPRELQNIFKRIPGRFSGPATSVLGVTGFLFFSGIALGVGITGFAIADIGAKIFSGIAAGFGLACGGVLGRGILSSKRAKRYLNYQKLIKDRSHILLEDLQQKTGYAPKLIKKDVHEIVDQHLLPVSYIDEQETCLILSEEVYQQYLDAEKGRIAREKEAEAMANASPMEKRLREIESDEMHFLRALEDSRASIDTPHMREKVDRLRTLISRLYVCVKEHPEKYEEVYRVRDYYLPTVLKLLKTYDEIEMQPIQGDNIIKTKQEIEKSLDMINQAMEVMFDALFRDIAMDTSADISVLETMLSREGWNGQSLNAEGEAPPTLHF